MVRFTRGFPSKTRQEAVCAHYLARAVMGHRESRVSFVEDLPRLLSLPMESRHLEKPVVWEENWRGATLRRELKLAVGAQAKIQFSVIPVLATCSLTKRSPSLRCAHHSHPNSCHDSKPRSKQRRYSSGRRFFWLEESKTFSQTPPDQ